MIINPIDQVGLVAQWSWRYWTVCLAVAERQAV